MVRRYVVVGLLAIYIALSLASCGGGDSTPATNTPGPTVSVVSAASYKPIIAPSSVAIFFGDRLASAPVAAEDSSNNALPKELGGVSVQVNGFAAELIYVSPSQINFVVPQAVGPGEALVEVFRANEGSIAQTRTNVAMVALGLFTVDGSESGLGAMVNATTQKPGPFAVETPENPTGDKRTRLAAFGTGFRFANPNNLVATAADYYGKSWTLLTESFGPSEDHSGVDKLVFVLPGEVDTSGIVNVTLNTDGTVTSAASTTTNLGTSNTVSSNIQSQTTCNVPVMFQESPGVTVPHLGSCGDYNLCFTYNWKSSDGAMPQPNVPYPQLSTCTIYEQVDYPRTFFPWFNFQSPPFLKVASPLNPTILAAYNRPGNGIFGVFVDRHGPGVDTFTYPMPFILATDQLWTRVSPFFAQQKYYYECQCAGGTRKGDLVHRTIGRSVSVSPDRTSATYSIAKGESERSFSLPKACDLAHTCSSDPTFIQVSHRQPIYQGRAIATSAVPNLLAKISVPYEDALVRAEVPIFGLASGEHFKNYRVEVGRGGSPVEWQTVFESSKPQTKDVTATDMDSSANLPIRGNLATWDTGLTNYVYLPSHPKDHPALTNGRYTIRLIITGEDGSQAQDQVQVTVANEIPNAWGGVVTSADGNVRLRIPEQALVDSFRLVSIEEAPTVPHAIPDDHQLIGPIYEVREAGEHFTKEADLNFHLTGSEVAGQDLSHLGIYAFDHDEDRWTYLHSARSENYPMISTKTRHLYPYYALMVAQQPGEGSTVSNEVETASTPRKVNKLDHFLIRNDFETGLEEWSTRDYEFGATVSLDSTATFDGSGAVKITKPHAFGNFGVDVIRTPFDAREYGVVRFNYRVPRGVKTNFLVKVAGRWYEIGFVGARKDLKNRRVNISYIGTIEGIKPDDQWHTAQFNLYEMLRNKTHHTVIEEMIMADWEVPGYMKLIFGASPEGSTYYIDNFSIARDTSAGLQVSDETLLIDNFNQKKETNAFGGRTEIFVSPSSGQLESSFAAGDNGYALALAYDVTAEDSYAGYISNLPDLDLRNYATLSVSVKGDSDTADMLIGVRDHHGREAKLPVGSYLESRRISTDWQVATIPLVAFSDKIDWRRVNGLSLSFEHSDHSVGTIFIDQIQTVRSATSVEVDRFEMAEHSNLLNQPHQYVAQGAAAINGRRVREPDNHAFQISYGGSIGAIHKNDREPFSFGMWKTELGGIDCSKCETISLRIRGTQGGERPNLYLSDGTFRWGVPIEAYVPVTKEWQEVRIPLKTYAEYGVDLTHLDAIEVVFEWEKMSGTVYIDDIRFGASHLLKAETTALLDRGEHESRQQQQGELIEPAEEPALAPIQTH